MSTAPDGLPPLRRPSPSGVRKIPRARPWYGEPDVLCILAILLALVGIFPHAEASLADLIRALRGQPAVTQAHASETGDPKPQSGDGNQGPDVHADIMVPPAVASTPKKVTP